MDIYKVSFFLLSMYVFMYTDRHTRYMCTKRQLAVKNKYDNNVSCVLNIMG